MSKVYGIDLGTTYSAIATLNDSGMPEVIENFADSSPLLASAVYFPDGGGPVVGNEAKNQLEIEPQNVVQFVKREIGKPDAMSRDFGGITYDPVTISALILKRMKEYAGEQGHDVENVVITCPAYFGIEERNATEQAGKIAGLNVLNIVNEPTAAALNYLAREFKESRKILVYDLGGGTFDVTLIDFSVDDSGKSSIDVIRSGGHDQLGGKDWDSRLYGHICDLYADENGVSVDDMDAELRQKIRANVELTKKSLSNLKNKSFAITYDGEASRFDITREKFEELSSDLVTQTINYVNKVLQDEGLSPSDVEVVLMVGGSTKMPMVKDAVENMFPGKVRVEDPDLAVAKGAAFAAATEFNESIREYIERKEQQEITGSAALEQPEFSGGFENFVTEQNEPISVEEAKSMVIDVPKVLSDKSQINDILSRSFGPKILNETEDFLIIDNILFVRDKAPSTETKMYGTIKDNQDAVKLEIFENIAERGCAPIRTMDSSGNEIDPDPSLLVKNIGEVVLELPPNTPAGSPIEVTICGNTKGIDVIARNPQTNHSIKAFFESQHGMSETELNDAIKRFASIKTSGQI